jgi:membrane-bound lytic murein transglycosylase B
VRERARAAFLLAVLAVTPAFAQEDFPTWLAACKQEALTRGISQATLDAVLADVQPLSRVIELDRSQPEFVETFSDYLERRVTPRQIERGMAMLVERQALFDEVEQRYGVPRQILAAFWGMETNYGSMMGAFPTPRALATLAHDGRRSAFFRAELFDALGILEAGHVAAADMKGSWAGAIGHMQFMPSTFRQYAVDGDADGRINVWSSLPDALHSAGNYMSKAGWQAGEPAAVEVRLPENFDWRFARITWRRPVAEWRAAGVRLVAPRPPPPGAADVMPKPGPHPNPPPQAGEGANVMPKPIASPPLPNPLPQAGEGANVMPKPIDGAPLPEVRGSAAIVLPQGWRGPTFMVFDNFDVILQWNRSLSYALSVAHMADRFSGGVPLASDRNVEREALSRAQVIALQQKLTEMGFDAGSPDGLPGFRTQSAIRRFQSVQGQPVDGYASPGLLARVERKHTEAAASGRLTLNRTAAPTFSEPAN